MSQKAPYRKGNRFWDKIAPRYARGKIKDFKSYQRKLKMTQEHFTKEMRVLEIGCGTGMTAVIHAPYVAHYHASDISGAMIDIAKNRAKEKQIENISFEVSDVLQVSVQDQSQDAVLAMSVLHLLDDLSAGMRAIREKLKPGGLFISSTICLGDKMRYLKIVVFLLRLVGYAPSTVHFFTKAELRATIQANRFAILHEWQPSLTKACFIIARKE